MSSSGSASLVRSISSRTSSSLTTMPAVNGTRRPVLTNSSSWSTRSITVGSRGVGSSLIAFALLGETPAHRLDTHRRRHLADVAAEVAHLFDERRRHEDV